MRKTLAICLTCVAFISQTFARVHAGESLQDWLDAEEEISEFLPRLEALGDEYPDDAEIQLGLGFLYGEYGDTRVFSDIDQYEKVLTIDPNNKTAWAMKVDLLCTYYTAKRRDLLDQLEGMIANARKRNVEELKLYKDSELYRWFKEEGKGTAVIKDFERAVQQLREKLDEKAPAVLATLNKGQSKDPENAFYNYLKAHLYFELDEKEKALKEIEEGAAKKYFSSYVEEISNAKVRVLEEAKFPQPHRDLIVSIRSPFEDFLIQGIWKRGLADLGKSYEAQGAFKKSEKVYRLAIKMAEQSQRESIYRPLGLDVMGHNCIEELQKKMLDQAPLEIGKYAVMGGLCGILIISFILLLRKKAISRSK